MISRLEIAKQYLTGEGIEIAASNVPVFIQHFPEIHVKYVDKYSTNELFKKFPELESSHSLVEPEIINDITAGIQIGNEQCDFIIACHILEQLPDPIFILTEFYRILKNGGRCFVSIPSKNFNDFIKDRHLTSLEHLEKDYRNKTRIVEDFHVIDHLIYSERISLPMSPIERHNLIDFHRERGIKVHVWNYDTFTEFITRVCREYVHFKIIKSYQPIENDRKEIIFILEK